MERKIRIKEMTLRKYDVYHDVNIVLYQEEDSAMIEVIHDFGEGEEIVGAIFGDIENPDKDLICHVVANALKCQARWYGVLE